MTGTPTFVRNQGTRLCTQTFGARSDPAIVLIMGATASMMWWPDSLCQALAAARRFVIRFDHRDTGRSSTGEPGEPGYDVEDLAGDVLAILDAYQLGQAHLVGMSLGGLIAQWVALAHPERVSTLALIAAEPLGGEPLPPLEMSPAFLDHFGTMASLDWEDSEAVRAFLDGIAQLSSSPSRGYDHSATAERIERELARATNIRSSFNHASMPGDLRHWDLRSIAVPTLVLHGAHDPIVPVLRGEAIARQIEGAELRVLSEAGHELHGSDLGAIAGWIAAHTGGPAS